jgi:poly(3-hydroxybutyrate) depolymerase
LSSESFDILLALHGLGDNYPDNFQRATSFDQLSDETKDFVVVYPLGSTCIGTEGW